MGSSFTKERITELNEAVSSVLNTTLTSISNSGVNTVQVTQSAKVIVDTGGVLKCQGDIVLINQSIDANLRFVTSFTNQNAVDIKNALQNDLENKNSQIMKVVREMFADIGLTADDQIEANMTNIVSSLVSNFTKTDILNSVLNASIIVQGGDVLIRGTIEGGAACKGIDQSAQLTVFTETLTKNITESIVGNNIVNRLINDSKQSLTKEEKGLASLAFWLAIAAVIGYLFLGKIESMSSIKLVLAILIIVALALGAAWLFGLSPFKKPRKYWGTLKNSTTGFYDYTCAEYDNIKDGPYSTEEECNNTAIFCSKASSCSVDSGSKCDLGTQGQYWGKDSTGKVCKQYPSMLNKSADGKTVYDAPYFNKDQCERCI